MNGAKALPWVVAHRDRLRRNGDRYAHAYLSCEECQMPHAVKRQWHCGELCESEWCAGPGRYPRPRGWPWSPEEQPSTCPGWLVQLPQILEAARSRTHFEHGTIRELLDGEPCTKLLVDLKDIMDAEHNAVVTYDMGEAKRG